MKSKKKRRIIDGFMILLLIIGIGAFAYPFVSDALNNYLDQQIIAHYQAKASQEKPRISEKRQQSWIRSFF